MNRILALLAAADGYRDARSEADTAPLGAGYTPVFSSGLVDAALLPDDEVVWRESDASSAIRATFGACGAAIWPGLYRLYCDGVIVREVPYSGDMAAARLDCERRLRLLSAATSEVTP